MESVRLIENESGPENAVESKNIKAIDQSSVHRICSGQVVLTLATAVKELVENSIDAGATTVEIRLKDYGSETIEVTDNGCGVEEANFQELTLKHYTSKLANFEELVNVETFGFRGEALSSLCALSNVSLLTRHRAAVVGTKLEFDQNGKITSRKTVPRQIGTTVIIQNIFHTLPVRHKEFHRNLRKEFSRLVQVLNAYCIISTGVRVSCTNQTSKGSKSTVVLTNGNQSMKENIANVFGPKQIQNLLELKQVEADEDVCSDFGLKTQNSILAGNFRISGFVSKCEHGQGRSSTDRQFIFINNRPCDAVKISKLINEVYHSYNRHQNPFIAISIEMDRGSVDVNVTPDKRQIFLEGEKLLLAILKTSLMKLYEPTTSVYQINNIISDQRLVNGSGDASQASSFLSSSTNDCHSPHSRAMSSQSLSSSLSKLKRSFSSAFVQGDHSTENTPNKKCNSPFPASKSHSFPSQLNSSKAAPITNFFSRHSPKLDKTNNQSSPESHGNGVKILNKTSIFHRLDQKTEEKMSVNVIFENNETLSKESNLQLNIEPNNDEDSKESNIFEIGNKNENSEISIDCEQNTILDSSSKIDLKDSLEANSFNDFLNNGEDTNMNNDIERNSSVLVIEDIEEKNVEKAEKKIKFSFSKLRKIMKEKNENQSSSSFCRSFRAKICPGDNKCAEEELRKEISKDMFSEMLILGQFNLGFIITLLGDDLFIVDQHATDEKFNFEMLQRHTVLHNQKLIIPQCLELTSSNETILVDNIEIFHKNGFEFLIDENQAPTQRVKLVSAPVSKNWNFGKEDIEELLFMLSDSPNTMCRPSRIRLMFASRSCRKSIMIGTALSKAEMRKVVSHMGEIDHPWNCPHGRPTMRHLFNLGMLPS